MGETTAVSWRVGSAVPGEGIPLFSVSDQDFFNGLNAKREWESRMETEVFETLRWKSPRDFARSIR